MIDGEYKVEVFQLTTQNFEAAAELITEAFLSDEAAQKEGTSILFDVPTFRRIFGSPFVKDQLSIRVVHTPTGNLVGFMGGLPRTLSIRGGKRNSDSPNSYLIMVPSWAAVHPMHKRKGIGSMMAEKFIDEVPKLGYHYSYAIYEPEQKGIDLGKSTADRSCKIKSRTWFKINWFFIRIFDLKAVQTVMKLGLLERLVINLISPPQVKLLSPNKMGNYRLSKEEDIPMMAKLLEEYQETKTVAIQKDLEDFEWYMKQPGIICCVHENSSGVVDGFILAWAFRFAGFGNTIPFGWLDLVHIDRLNRREAADLVRYFNYQVKFAGWKGIQSPYIPYFPRRPFLKANFLPFPKRMIVQLYGLVDADFSSFLKPPKTCFLDWR